MSIHAFPPQVHVLLPPTALFVVNLFRRFDRFRHGYDQAHLDAADASVRERLGERSADGVMSDALMVDNELRLRTSGAFSFNPDGSPQATPDELSLLSMIAAMQTGHYRVAAECAVELDIIQSRTMLMLAHRLGSRLAAAGLRLDTGVLQPSWTADRETPPPPRASSNEPHLHLV
ncbi:hypothetical protein NK718_01935 [Alsobacter sp. SYSU M60028]|uniref:MarR family transcriptional regulator n=1 Tax=Alsobacter ponti TaxID=2962936 RepID=A0ABT1L728_9HYPH|nr:hypothetical protein [Alsobacter ponti]MCP8937262.1 hypothetical protein [Alsobacter ponti]